jgi:hypothetical protein
MMAPRRTHRLEVRKTQSKTIYPHTYYRLVYVKRHRGIPSYRCSYKLVGRKQKRWIPIAIDITIHGHVQDTRLDRLDEQRLDLGGF